MLSISPIKQLFPQALHRKDVYFCLVLFAFFFLNRDLDINYVCFNIYSIFSLCVKLFVGAEDKIFLKLNCYLCNFVKMTVPFNIASFIEL